jgi:hypothetical protein
MKLGNQNLKKITCKVLQSILLNQKSTDKEAERYVS